MIEYVLAEVLLCEKGLLAVAALVWLILQVKLDMLFQAELVCKALTAQVAENWPLEVGG